MKAIAYSRYGPPSVLSVREFDKPTPQANEVLVRIRAVEVTKACCELRSFKFPVSWFWLPLRVAFGIRKPKNPVLGGYFSGQVDAVGSGVNSFQVGDKVLGCSKLRLGAYAQYAAYPAEYTIAKMPDQLSFEEAACLLLGGLNAIHFMRVAKIKPQEHVLINGAGGSIGHLALQIAKSMGAKVTVVDGPHKKDFLMDLGADSFIDYTQEDFRSKDQNYDVIFDMVPHGSYSGCIEKLNPKGRYLSGNPRLTVMVRSIITSVFSNKKAFFSFAGESQEELESLITMAADRTIRPIIDQVYSMDQAAEAHERVDSESRKGCVVIKVA